MGIKTKLTMVPTFTFNQGDLFSSDTDVERPISVDFYKESIVLRQDGDGEAQDSILISRNYFDRLVKEIKANIKEADTFLNK